MQRFLSEMAQVGVNDSLLILNRLDLEQIDSKAPRSFAFIKENPQEVTFIPEILDFPIGFSLAVYPYPITELPMSRTPLLWTRGLQNYEDFEGEYGGHVAYLDGHVEYFSGSPNNHDPDLVELFSSEGIYGKAIRILEHEPDAWKALATLPLPMRFHEDRYPRFQTTKRLLTFLAAPSIIFALFFFWVWKEKENRLVNALIVAGLVLFAEALLIPTVC